MALANCPKLCKFREECGKKLMYLECPIYGMKLTRINLNAGWFGFSKWGLKNHGIIIAQIAVREGYTKLGKKGKIYTAFYALNGEWVFKEFLKFREALEWLKLQLAYFKRGFK